MASLGARVDQLQLDVDHLLERSELAVMDSVVSRSQRKVDEHTGIYFETTTCTPLLCSLELTARTLGNHFLGKAAKNKTVQVINSWSKLVVQKSDSVVCALERLGRLPKAHLSRVSERDARASCDCDNAHLHPSSSSGLLVVIVNVAA